MSTRLNFQLINTVSEVSRGVELLEGFGRINNIPSKIITDFAIALDEIVTNIILYGYKETGDHTIFVKLLKEFDYMTITVEDSAGQFNPLERKDPELSLPIEEKQVGGLGIFIVKKLMDSVEYEYKDGKNIFKMKKYILSNDQPE